MGWRARTQLLGSPSPRFIQSDETCSPSIPIQVFELAPAFVLQLCICPLYLGEGGSNPSLPCPRSSQSRSPGCGSPILWAAPPLPPPSAPQPIRLFPPPCRLTTAFRPPPLSASVSQQTDRDCVTKSKSFRCDCGRRFCWRPSPSCRPPSLPPTTGQRGNFWASLPSFAA